MDKIQSPQGELLQLFDEKKCYTIQELSQSLNYSLISVRRFLKKLGYYSSFTHNSKWYTLCSIPSFNEHGLWFYKDIGFSKYGNLNQTILYFVNTSERGLTAKELSSIILVPCHPVLNLLYKKKQIDRSHTPRGFVYFSTIEDIKMQQLDRLQSRLVFPTKQIQRLTAQAAVYVLVEFIKQPNASFSQLSKAVKKRQIVASEEAIAQLFKEHDIKKNSEIVDLLYYYQKQVQIQNVPAKLFDNPPTLYFKPDERLCPVCKIQLHVFKTTTRLIKMLGIGQFTAHHTFLYCPNHPNMGPWQSTELHKLVPQDANVAYNVIVETGKLRFFKKRQVTEIKLILDEKYAVNLSTSEIERLINSFIFYLAAIHQENKDLIKAYIDSQGGYILHLDATCEADSPKLVSSIDPISGFVLYSAKLKSENKDDMITFLEEIKKGFGIPHAVMSDMSKGIKAAVEFVFGDIPHFVCHFHFLSIIGQILFDKENTLLRNALSKAGISGDLKEMRRKLAQKFNNISRHEIENFLKEPEKMAQTLVAPEICLYYLIQWILDHGSSGNGYGFPFDQRYLDFYKRLNTAYSIIENIRPLYTVNNKSIRAIRKLYHLIKEVIDNSSLQKIVERYKTKVSIFSELRQAFGTTPDSVNNGLNNMKETTTVQEFELIKESVKKFIANLKEKVTSTADKQIADSYIKTISRIEEYGERLFVDPLVVMVKGEKKVFFIHRTNNIMEHHFRKLSYSYRRVHGNHSVRRNLENIPEHLPLVENLKNPNYIKLIFNDERKIIEKFAEIDAKIIREMRLKHKSEEKIYTSRQIKKVIRLPNFNEQLIGAFASVAS